GGAPGGGEVPGGTAAPGGGAGQGTPEGWRAVRGRLGTLDLNGDPSAAASLVGALRVFAGYAGWGPGQLAGELSVGGWILVDSEDDDAFTANPDGLWKAVLRRQGGDFALLAAYPLDPSAN
ncbi:MAG: YqgE/AlgH family protein, partial [Acidimicrobiales bacterium]